MTDKLKFNRREVNDWLSDAEGSLEAAIEQWEEDGDESMVDMFTDDLAAIQKVAKILLTNPRPQVALKAIGQLDTAVREFIPREVINYIEDAANTQKIKPKRSASVRSAFYSRK